MEDEYELYLIGCQMVADHGFALPIFGSAYTPNKKFVAECAPEGDGEGRVARFVEFATDDLTRLPVETFTRVRVGDPWISVFFWEGTAYVGSSQDTWRALGSAMEQLVEDAPLSLISLALDADQSLSHKLASAARAFLISDCDDEFASHWIERALHRHLWVRLRRALVREGEPAPTSESVSVVLIGDRGCEVRVSSQVSQAAAALVDEVVESLRPSLKAFGVSAYVVVEMADLDRGDANAPPSRRRVAEAPILRVFELTERVRAYYPAADLDLINRAYVYAMRMYGDERRPSGDPYFAHPVIVAGLLADYKLDATVIATALLSQIVEETPATRSDIESLFGQEIGGLVEGVNRIIRLDLRDIDHAAKGQNEALTKMIIATSKDLRVLLVALADKIQKLRTLQYIRPERREETSHRALAIHAPLARVLGMHSMAVELENAAFAYLNPTAKEAIDERMSAMLEEHRGALASVPREIEKILRTVKLQGDVSSRYRRSFSIWREMKDHSVGFSGVSHFHSFKVALDSEDDCYKALGAVHRAWPMVPDRFADFLSGPSSSRHRSLYTTIMWPSGIRFEMAFHVRASGPNPTEYEHSEIAERVSDLASNRSVEREPWLESAREIAQEIEEGRAPDAELESRTQFDAYLDRVFVFTPKGRLISLPSGAMPLDFAYAIHTEVGHRAMDVLINGERQSMRSVLKSGDVVEIMPGVGATPDDWRSLTVTRQARSAIRKQLRLHVQRDAIQRGRLRLREIFGGMPESLVSGLILSSLDSFGAESLDALAERIGLGQVSAEDVFAVVVAS